MTALITRVVVLALATLSLQQIATPVPLARFVEATREDDRTAAAALQAIAADWRDGYAAMFVDMARMMPGPRNSPPAVDDNPPPIGSEEEDGGNRRPIDLTRGLASPDRGSPIRRRLLSFLERQTGKRFGQDLDAWRRWMWALPYNPHPEYATLKAAIYGQIDPQMRSFFPPGVTTTIRLDEID
ncbi:MAG: hypothetical protein AB7N65_29520, partial [Vicinamibacterales bacterium]